MPLRVLVANVPETRKPGLIQPPQLRARRLFRLLNRQGVDIGLVQESGKWAMRQARDRPRWRRAYAAPMWRRGGNHKATGVLARRPVRILDRAQIGPKDRRLAVALCETPEGFRFVAISGHAPTRRDDPNQITRTVIRVLLATYVADLGDVPVVVGIDANAKAYEVTGLRPVARHGVDHLLVSPHFRWRGGEVLHRPRLSDHDFLLADLHPGRQGVTLERLPRCL